MQLPLQGPDNFLCLCVCVCFRYTNRAVCQKVLLSGLLSFQQMLKVFLDPHQTADISHITHMTHAGRQTEELDMTVTSGLFLSFWCTDSWLL